MAADRTTFVGVIVPPEIKVLGKVLGSLPPKQGGALVKAVVDGEHATTLVLGSHAAATLNSFEGREPTDEELSALVGGFKVSQDVVNDVFAGLHSLLHHAFKVIDASAKQETIKEDLDLLGIAAEFQPAIIGAIFSSSALQNLRVRLPKLEKLQWRVDVSISTSSLKRAMRPSVLTQMTLSNGDINTFEMSVDQFHQLRYSVAYVLKEMEEIEKKGQA